MKQNRKHLGIILFIYLVFLPLFNTQSNMRISAQDTTENSVAPPKETKEITKQLLTDEQKREQRLKELRIRSLQDDIATASYFELQSLARELGLDPNLAIEALRTSLHSKLEISAPAKKSSEDSADVAANENNANDEENLLIRIESAQKAQAFTIERQPNDKEDYFKISGGVKIFITDQKAGEEHSVHADSIVLNRKQNTIRAEGKVTYIKKKLGDKNGSDIEKFTGDSLIFRLNIWRGVILYGVFSRNQTTDTPRPADIHSKSSNPEKTKADPNASQDKDSLLGKGVLAENHIRYYFDGQKIRKGTDDVLVLEQGTMSSSQREQNEYFRLSFHRLWIFGKPEWAMLSATLYVGHIPVLYLPYYYYNDNRILFHPVFGIREAYGEFLQTTTYLLGKPPAADTDSLSFIPVNTGADENSNLKLDALFLAPCTEEDKKREEKKFKSCNSQNQGKTSKDSYIKFLFDYYSYIGLFTGFSGQVKNLGPINSLNFETSLAYAYALEERGGFNSNGQGFLKGKPFILNDEGKYQLKHIEGNFFGEPIPFRFGLSLKTKLNHESSSFNLDFQHYSDPFYRRDYFNRKESFDWIDYTLERLQRDSTDELEEWRKKEAVLNSYKWEFGLSLNPKLQSSWLSSLSLKTNAVVYFNQKDDSTRKIYDPNKKFFYPTKLFIPDTTISLSGTLWPLKKTSVAQKKIDLPILEDWKYKPNSSKTSEPSEGEQEESDIGKPEKLEESLVVTGVQKPKELKKIELDQQVKTLSFKATYNIVLQNSFESQTDNSKWTRIEDVTLNNKELKLNGKEALQLVTNWKFLDSFLSVGLKHDMTFYVSHYFDIGREEADTDSNGLDATKQASKWDWTETANITLKPFYLLDWLSESSISYTLRAIIYDYKYNTTKKEYEKSFLDLDMTDKELRKRITTHRLVSQLNFQPIKNAYNPINNLQINFTFTNELPPANSKHTLKTRLFFEIFKWSHDLSLKFEQVTEDGKEEDPEFYLQPLSYISMYKPIEKLEIKKTLVLNFEPKNQNREPHLDKLTISFKAWWFRGNLDFRYTEQKAWDKNSFTWKTNKTDDPILQASTTFLSFDLTTKDRYFWKNRILFYFTFNTRWDQDLIEYNEKSSLTLDFTLSFFIYEFLNIQISYRMSNEKLYLYYPGMNNILGFSQERSFLQDLWYSLHFWDEERQKQGLFKMKDLRLLAIHHLKDWDLIFEFVGKPKQIDNKLSWDYAIGFYLRWIPIPLIKRRATVERDIWKTDAR